MSRLTESIAGGPRMLAVVTTLVGVMALACAGGSSESDSTPASAAQDDSVENTAIAADEEHVVGCWAVHAGEWSDVPGEVAGVGEAMAEAKPTWLVRLDSAEAPKLYETSEPGRAAYTYLEGVWRDHPFQRWRVVNDSIVVDHPAAFAGTTLRATAEPSGLVGMAVAHTDVVPEGKPVGAAPPRRYAAVRMYGVECPE